MHSMNFRGFQRQKIVLTALIYEISFINLIECTILLLLTYSIEGFSRCRFQINFDMDIELNAEFLFNTTNLFRFLKFDIEMHSSGINEMATENIQRKREKEKFEQFHQFKNEISSFCWLSSQIKNDRNTFRAQLFQQSCSLHFQIVS